MKKKLSKCIIDIRGLGEIFKIEKYIQYSQ